MLLSESNVTDFADLRGSGNNTKALDQVDGLSGHWFGQNFNVLVAVHYNSLSTTNVNFK